MNSLTDKPSESPTPRTTAMLATKQHASEDWVKSHGQLERELAEMTRFRDMNNAELGRMTEKCNALRSATRRTSCPTPEQQEESPGGWYCKACGASNVSPTCRHA